ncbi:phosphoribosylglycinamide formyltransferase 2 [Bacillus siamensis]|uniref:phosphoribosylglycinamide formyltransferase 2 n=1 Tax=Bacillus siamensis TaxID=659243 RepID=UPI0018E6381A|nr:phosphoribosylglycinamide formyltransferase 2 [Bacillus siamensis]MED0773603.1 phosphoribosylglycinamide formyltransferase 2 [Bacillus siamensis]MED0775380.1 phosphoribosylglycinamide formyltransferase 2 [Bacillus siamensis]MED0781425.1 phosphoribosylglycinamide formyltransferase 2 [Bacillus siamensis]MED0834901.1 phosphoribosylglycinamide formyltransferase 2 [Bacillus siamensis]QQD82309.1 phosphoribosylglycinamide formyltransferase 2 [Bacillus siamensis]
MYQAKKMLLLGSGELGKEVVIEAQRLGVVTVAVDSYEHAPAMQTAHKSYVIDMLDKAQVREVIEKEKPDLIVPEVEAIATDELLKLEEEGFHVIPNARAAKLTMDREGIRRLAAEKLHLPTAGYEFANTYEEFKEAAETIGFPCVVKPLMSSSGKGQSVCRSASGLESCWNMAMEGGRVKNGRVIVEEFIPFESEITLLTVRAANGTSFCAPIGHEQKDGDYIESWQPHHMTEQQIEEAKHIAKSITDELGGYGLFGVELFLTEDKVYFSEVSPRPHDTGLVTLVTQNLSEFALHVRAIMGFPIPEITQLSPGASRPLKAPKELADYAVEGVEKALAVKSTQVRIFGKPVTKAGRRMAVALSAAETVEEARERAAEALSHLSVT